MVIVYLVITVVIVVIVICVKTSRKYVKIKSICHYCYILLLFITLGYKTNVGSCNLYYKL